jgi:hypothetical protein
MPRTAEAFMITVTFSRICRKVTVIMNEPWRRQALRPCHCLRVGRAGRALVSLVLWLLALWR